MLQHLSLCQNKFSGFIPFSVSNLSRLETLNLISNFIEGTIPFEIGRLKHLKILAIAENRLSGIIPSTISNLSSLELLSLPYNFLSGEIPSFLFNMPSLRWIDFQLNNLHGNLPQEMCHHLPLLELFSLYGNQFEGSIPISISNCTSLKNLYLGGNFFTGLIPKEIGNLDKLDKLKLSSNYLTGPIPGNFFNISTLTYLGVAHNYISDLLPSNIGCDLPNLRLLHLQENELTGKISKSLSNASNLVTLELYKNKFSGVIPSTLGNLTNLLKLSLEWNYLNGPIPSTNSRLQGLQYLGLSYNKFQGTIIDELCKIKSLSELYLDYNELSGLVPSCIGNLTSLRKLQLGSNKLISQIPSSLWSLRDILVVNLSSNALSGCLPNEISNLKALAWLDMSKNQILGNIPTTIGGLQTLQGLSLAHNKLQGPIPDSLGSMISIVFLDLSKNYLSGMISKSLESLDHLEYLNLSYNVLYGEIPSGGSFTNFTAESFMMNEALCGKPQLQVQPCRKVNKQRPTKELLLIKYLFPIVLAAILVVSCIVFLKCKKDYVGDSTNNDLFNFETPIRISYYELLKAKNGFDESNFLSRGSFGSVFIGILTNGKIVAIKIFNLDSEEASRNFDIECNAMCNLRHRNLVKIISSCSNADFKSLIMDFMPNGSLERWLYSYNYCLDLLQRLNIMIDVASALEYLHHGSSTPVVHCDVKPNNVLLDGNMAAHLVDFGIAKLLGEGQFETHTNTFATLGYIAPEYGTKGVVSMKGDVYSYGIMLMEMFTRKKPTNDMFNEGLSLKGWVSMSIPHSITHVLDYNLFQQDNQNIGDILPHISSILELALNCCIDLPETRINMTDVVVSLNKSKVILMSNGRGTTSLNRN